MRPLHEWHPGVVAGVGAVAGAMLALGLWLLLLAARGG
jgi:hypothetical protein